SGRRRAGRRHRRGRRSPLRLIAMQRPGDDTSQLVEAFCEALWLEDGLAKNTLEAYRRDLLLYAQWLQADAAAPPLAGAGAIELQRYIAARHPSSKATSAN